MKAEDIIALVCACAVTGFVFTFGAFAILNVAKTADQWQETHTEPTVEDHEGKTMYVDAFGVLHEELLPL